MSPSSGWSDMRRKERSLHVAIVRGIGEGPKGWDREKMVKWVQKSSYRHYGAPEITEFANTLDFDGGITPESIKEAAVRLLERMRKEIKESGLSKSFQVMARIYPIVNLYECINEEALQSTPLAFSKDTPTMGVPGEVCDRLRESENRGKYVKFLTLMDPWEEGQKDTYFRCLMELSRADSHHSLGEHVHLSSCTPEKFNWILDRDACKNWIGPVGRPLWLYGMAKSDVATSMDVLERKARATFPDANVIKYSFDAQDDRCRATYGMLVSLSHQLLTLKPGLFEHVRYLYYDMHREVEFKIEHLWAFLRSLLSCPPKRHGVIFCFINMIDECDPSSNKFLKDPLLLASSETSAGGFRLAVTSHKAPDYDVEFAAHAINVIQERHEDPDEKKKEIESVVARETRLLFEARPGLEKLDGIINEKLSAVDDVFNISLIAKLLQGRLPNWGDAELETQLSSLPRTTFEIYRHFLDSIPADNQSWARDVLSWIIHAFQPLKVTELALAMALQDDTLSILELQRLCLRYLSLVTSPTEESKPIFDSKNFFTPPEGIEYGFLDYAGQYWFRHYNLAKHDAFPDLQDEACAFLERPRSGIMWCKLKVDPLTWQHGPFNPAHVAISLGCNDVARTLLEKPEWNAEVLDHSQGLRLTTTRETAIDSLWEAGARHGVILYAAAMRGRDELVDQILKDQAQVEMGKEYISPYGRTALHQASSFGYHAVVRKLLNASYNANVKNDKELVPLHLASRFGHVDVIEALLTGKEKADDENMDTDTHPACAAVVDKSPWLVQESLMMAIDFQQHDAIKKLLDQGAKLEKNPEALAHAVASGREDIVGLILRYYEKLPANILHEAMATRGKDDYTPLELAARGGYMDVVRQLLDKIESRMDTTETEDMKKTWTWSFSRDMPLHLAAGGGHAHVLKALIEWQWPQDSEYRDKSNIGATNSLGQAPIHLAVLGGDASLVVQLCLEHQTQKVPLNLLDNRRRSPLHVACDCGLVDMVDILLEHGGWYGGADGNGDTPLLLGCAAGDLQMVKRLLTHDSNLLIKNLKGRSALHHAAASGEPDVVQELLRASSDANDIRIYANAKDESGSTPLHLAAVAGNVQVMKILLDEKADITQVDGSGHDVLYLASRHGHANMVIFLIQESRKGIEGVDGETFHFGWDIFQPVQELLSNFPHNLPLAEEADIAVEIGSKENCVQILTNLTSLPNQWTPSQYGITLNLAAKWGIISVVDQVLLKGQDPNYVDTKEKTALMYAAESGCSRVVERLLRVPNIGQDCQDKYGHSAISYAAENGHLEVVKMLASGRKSAIDAKTLTAASKRMGNTKNSSIMTFLLDNGINGSLVDSVLRIAVSEEFDEVVSLLVGRGANVNTTYESTSTPLHKAARLGNVGICKILLKAGATVDSETKEKETPLILAVSRGHQELRQDTVPEAICARPEIFKAVLSKVLELNKSAHRKDAQNRSPLLLAAAQGTQEAFMALIDIKGADINERDDDGYTPLCHAFIRQKEAIVETLFKRPELQCSMSAKDMLQRAAGFENGEVLQMLLRNEIHLGLEFDDLFKLAMETENLHLVEIALQTPHDGILLDKHG
ncbi:ankyrin 2,3/unc44 [Metarhizium brunneum]